MKAPKRAPRDPARVPPPGPPWDEPIERATFAFLDLEMTGLDVDQDHIVEVCIRRVVGDTVAGELDTLVRPLHRAGGAAHVHGLDADVLEGAPSFADVAPRILELLDGAIPVAHAAEWDLAFLEHELARPPLGRTVEFPFWLDTLILSRRAFALPSHSLDALATSLALDRGRAHRAGDDVRAMIQLFGKAMLVLSPTSARDLWEVRIAERKARESIVEACRDAVQRGLPVAVSYRPSKKGAQACKWSSPRSGRISTRPGFSAICSPVVAAASFEPTASCASSRRSRVPRSRRRRRRP